MTALESVTGRSPSESLPLHKWVKWRMKVNEIIITDIVEGKARKRVNWDAIRRIVADDRYHWRPSHQRSVFSYSIATNSGTVLSIYDFLKYGLPRVSVDKAGGQGINSHTTDAPVVNFTKELSPDGKHKVDRHMDYVIQRVDVENNGFRDMDQKDVLY